MEKVVRFYDAVYEWIERRVKRFFSPSNPKIKFDGSLGFRRSNDLYHIQMVLRSKAVYDRSFFCTEVHGKHLCLSKNPLFVFREESFAFHEMRNLAIWLVEWKWFDRCIMLTIFGNLILMMYPASYDPAKAGSGEKDFFYVANALCVALFALESVLKIIARGLICSNSPDRPYLREMVNILDFAIVVTSLIEFGIISDREGSKLVLIRFMRCLRPLRTIQRMPTMRMMATSLLDSTPRLARWLGTVIFICMVFTLIGQSFFGTIYWNRCRLTPRPILNQTSGLMMWPVDPDQQKFCGGRYSCKPRHGNATYCGRLVTMADGVQDNFGDPWEEITSSAMSDFGYSGFETFYSGMFTVFQVANMEGWTTLLYRYQDGRGNAMSLFFFCGLVVFSGLVLLNLVLGVLWERFDREMKNFAEQGSQKEPKVKNKEMKEISEMKLVDLVHEVTELEMALKETSQRAKYDSGGGMGIVRSICFSIVSQPSFDQFMLGVIVVNCTALAIDSHPPLNESVEKVRERINLFCTLFFTAEAAFKIFSLGFKFFEEYLNVADLILVIAAFVELIAGGQGIVLALRVSRLLRVLKMMSQSVHVRVLLRVTTKATILTFNFFGMVLIILTGVAVCGLHFFHTDEDSRDTDQLQFTDMYWSFILTCALLTGERWPQIMINASRKQDTPVWIMSFFLTVFILCNLILINLFLGMFVAAFATARDEVISGYRRSLYEFKYGGKGKAEYEAARNAGRSSTFFAIEEDDEEPPPPSPKFPLDIWKSRPCGPTKTAAKDMNILKMMQVKSAAAARVEKVVLLPQEQMYNDEPPMAPPVSHKNDVNDPSPLSSRLSAPSALRASKPEMLASIAESSPPSRSHSRVSFLGEEAPGNKTFATEQLHQSVPPDPELNDGYTDVATPSLPSRFYLADHWHRRTPPESEQFEDPTVGCKTSAANLRAPYKPQRLKFRELYLLAKSREDSMLNSMRVGASVARPKEPEVVPRGTAQVQVCDTEVHPVGDPNKDQENLVAWMSSNGEALSASMGAGEKSTPIIDRSSSEDSWSGGELCLHVRDNSTICFDIDTETPAMIPARMERVGNHGAQPPDDGSVPSKVAADKPPKPSGVQACCLKIVLSNGFEPSILALIIVSSACLALESPSMDKNSKLAHLLEAMEKTISMAFTLELIVKILAWGLFTKPSKNGEIHAGYFRSLWNWIDTVIVTTSLLDIAFAMAGTSGGDLKLIRILRLLRTLRPLRIITRNKGLKIMVETLMQAMPTLMRGVIISVLFYVGFGILFMNLLKGEMASCSLDPTGLTRSDIDTKEDCIRLGGTWDTAHSNFDHIGHSLVSVLHMGTGEGWIDVMIRIVNSRGVDLQPRRNHRIHLSFIVLIFVALGNFFLVNLLIGVLVDQYVVTRDTVYGIELQSMAERRWIGVQQRMLSKSGYLSPPWQVQEPLKRVRSFILILVESRMYETFNVTCVCLNALFLCLWSPTQSNTRRDAMLAFNILLCVYFNIDIMVKLFVYFAAKYFEEPWNVFDLIVTFGTNSHLAALIFNDEGSFLVSSLSIFRVLRVLRLVKIFAFLQTHCKTMLRLLPSLLNISLLLGLLLFIYTCLGVGLFGTIADGEHLGPDANFHTFGAAALLVLRICTGEQWQDLMYDVASDRANCTQKVQNAEELKRDGPLGCGSVLAYPYFVSFTSFVSIILMNLIIAVVLEGFQAVEQIESYEQYRTLIFVVAKEWKEVDHKASGYLILEDAAACLGKIQPPVGFEGQPVKKICHQLRYVPIYDGRVHFRDIVALAAKRVYAWMNHLPEKDANYVQIDAALWGDWCSFFPDVPKPNKSIQTFMVGHVLVKKFLDDLVAKRKVERRRRIAEAILLEDLKDTNAPLRKGAQTKLTNLKQAVATQAARGRNAAGLLMDDKKKLPLPEEDLPPVPSTNAQAPSAGSSERPKLSIVIPDKDFLAPSDAFAHTPKLRWAGAPLGWPPVVDPVRRALNEQADMSTPAQEVGLVGSGFDIPAHSSHPHSNFDNASVPVIR